MRDFLFSDIASLHGFNNVPDNPELAIAAGTRLCEELLEPSQDQFGRIATRSAFRSKEVNGFGNEMQKAGNSGYTCASNDSDYVAHIWDERDANGHMGATACIVAAPKGTLAAPGMANSDGSHEAEWAGIEVAFAGGGR